MWLLIITVDFPSGPEVKESACTAGITGSIPGLGRSPGGGQGYPLQCSRLGNPMDRGAWHGTIAMVSQRVGHN